MKKQKTIKEDIKDFITFQREEGIRYWVIYCFSLPFYLVLKIIERIFFYK